LVKTDAILIVTQGVIVGVRFAAGEILQKSWSDQCSDCDE
jgi:hypothetical protein